MNTELFETTHENTLLEAFVAYPSDVKKTLSVVIICHDWSGRGANAEENAKKFAKNGFIGIAIDLYGKGRIGNSIEENSSLMTPFMEDRSFLASRLLYWVNFVRENPKLYWASLDLNVAGFCFGGLCALDLARMNANVRKVVSFHGLFHSDLVYLSKSEKIRPSILALHGYNDPMVRPKDVISLGDELEARKADWMVHCYGNTVHAFSNKLADNKELGAVFNNISCDRSFKACFAFFKES